VPPQLQPMLSPAVSARWKRPPAQWRLEPKLDGWRALARLDGGDITVRTRHGRPVTHTLPELQDLPPALRGREVVLDGELIVGTGAASDFYRLGPRLARGAGSAPVGEPVIFMAFDVLWLDEVSTCDRSYAQRRALLESLQVRHGCWGTVDTSTAASTCYCRRARPTTSRASS
jgi:bifunctional non-homologous end joining protein LigD